MSTSSAVQEGSPAAESGSRQQGLSQKAMAKLEIKDHEDNKRTHELVDDVTTIGRSSSCTIQVTDEKASRQHFRIEKTGDRFKVIDLGSTNGTRLNGRKVTSEILCPGDVLRLGKTTFAYSGPGEPRVIDENADRIAEDDDDDIDEVDIFDANVPVESAALKKTIQEAQRELDLEKPKYILEMVEGPEVGKTFEFDIKPLTLGRKSSNSVKLSDESASSFHAEIKKEPIGFVISDLGSTNGTKVKAKGQDHFEKIIKTPLVLGAQIKIGKTVFEFKNIGAQDEDDEMMGTVVLDSDHLAKDLNEIAPRPEPYKSSQVPQIIVLPVAVLVFIGVVYLVVSLVGGDQPPPESKKAAGDNPASVATAVRNSDFSEGTDDYGNPKNWKYLPGQPGIRIEVSSEAECKEDTPQDKKFGLIIHKGGAQSPSCRSIVETMDSISVDSGRIYEISGAMKNEGDGQYGLRVVWLKGNREVAEHPVVLIRHQEYKTKSAELRPPSWADRARVGVFTEGREGSTCFDDISFSLKKDGHVDPAPTVSYEGISVAFEGTKGAFSIKSNGEQVLQGGTLDLVARDGKSETSLVSGIQPVLSSEGSKIQYSGRLYDFTMENLTNYVIAVGPGSAGVKLRFAVDKLSDHAAVPRISFDLVGKLAGGALEVTKPSGLLKLSAAANLNAPDVENITFNVGHAPQLFLSFDKPVKVDSVREGDRRKVTISFSGEVYIDIAPENVDQKQQLTKALKELDDSVRQKDWPRVADLKEKIYEKYALRFAEAKDSVRKAESQINDAWSADKTEVDNQVSLMEKFQTADPVRKELAKLAAKWRGTEFLRYIETANNKVLAIEKQGLDVKTEQEADKLLSKAKQYLRTGGDSLQVAISLLNKIMKDFEKTPAAKEAKDLLPEAETGKKEYDKLMFVVDLLKSRAEPFLRAGDYKGAIDTIKNHAEYKKNGAQLKELNEDLKTWEKKALGQ